MANRVSGAAKASKKGTMKPTYNAAKTMIKKAK